MASIVGYFTNCCRAPKAIKEQNFEQAIAANNVDRLRAIIQDESFNPNAALENGARPLHLAVHKPALEEIVISLLDKSANPLLEDNGGLTAVDHAMLIKGQKYALTLLATAVPLSEEDIEAVNHQKEDIGPLIQNAKSALATAYNLVRDAAPMAINLTQKGTFSKQDRWGLLPLHHTIKDHAAAPTEEIKIEKEAAIRKLFGSTDHKKITAKTKSDLTVAHFAAKLKDTVAVDEVVKHAKKSELLQSKTLTGLTPLHVALLNEDFATAKKFIHAEPETLKIADDQGLTPAQILLYNVLTHAENAQNNTGPIQNKELVLLALQVLIPLLQIGYESYFDAPNFPCTTPMARFIPTFLASLLYTAEYGQSNPPQIAAINGGIEAALAPQGIVGSFLKGRRVSSVAANALVPLQKSWHYSSYEPLSALKNGIVHLGTTVLSAGNTAYNWWYQ